MSLRCYTLYEFERNLGANMRPATFASCLLGDKVTRKNSPKWRSYSTHCVPRVMTGTYMGSHSNQSTTLAILYDLRVVDEIGLTSQILVVAA
jgi:hypothetical protein